jgi:uncharacterized membrane protein SirB2
MLRPEPQVTQRWQFNGWSGTPRQLADAVAAIRLLLPDADFRASVKKLGGPEQVTDEPAGLAAIPLELRFDMIEIELNEHRRRTESEWESDYYWVKLQFGRIDVWNSILCHGKNELESRAMLGAAKEALASGIPWHARIRGAMVWKIVASVVSALLVTTGIGLVVDAVTSSPRAAGLVAVAVFIAVYILAVVAIQWLLPNFELYSERTRRRRFAWAFLTLVVLPLLVGILATALAGSS